EEILVQKFFNRLLYSKDQNIQLLTAVVMLRDMKEVPDSIVNNLAANDKYRAYLYRFLKRFNKLDKFPAKYKQQELMARSLLVATSDYDRIDSMVLIKVITTTHLKDTGQVFFYKYRINKDDLWKMAFSGFQPGNKKEVATNNTFTVFSEKVLNYELPELEQFQNEFKKLKISNTKSGKYFYIDEDYKRF
ncbi:MAG: hypothetical protein ABIN48_08930, partial [Ginsengibacter sp.]